MKLTSAQVSHYGPQCNCNYILGKHKQLVSSFSAAIPQLMFVNDLDVQNSIVFREIRIDFFFQIINEDEFVFTDSSSKYDRRHFMNAVLEGVPDGRFAKYTKVYLLG